MIYVDADACPVRDEAVRVAERHGVALTFVANGGIRPSRHPLVRVVAVEAGADAADKWIADRIGPGDICVTADVPLAARCVADPFRPGGGKGFRPADRARFLDALERELRALARGYTNGSTD